MSYNYITRYNCGSMELRSFFIPEYPKLFIKFHRQLLSPVYLSVSSPEYFINIKINYMHYAIKKQLFLICVLNDLFKTIYCNPVQNETNTIRRLPLMINV